MKLAILTDSGSNLSKDFIEKHENLFVVPLLIMINGESYRDQLEITPREIYEQLDEKDITTSLPSLKDLKQTLSKIKKAGYTDLLVINISSGLSGTFNSFRIELESVKDLNITQYDSKTLAAGQGYLVEQALELSKEGLKVEEIIKALDKQRYKDSLAIYTINTLKYLKKGGRIGRVEATIGNLLNIKPVITVDDEEGVYITLSKSFGLKRALISMKNLFIKKFESLKMDLTVHYGNDLEKAKQLGEMLKKFLNVRNLTISELTPVLGIHTGPDMFAYVGRVVK